MHLLRMLAFALAVSVPAAAQAQGGASAPASPDLATLAEGAVIVSASDNALDALSLTDGSPRTNWKNSGKRALLPYSFVFELRAPTVVEAVGVVGSGKRPGGVAGASARTLVVEASSESRTAGFRRIAGFDAAEEGETMAAVAEAAPVRWLRFTVSTNHGSPIWTYMAEAVVRGRPVPPSEPVAFAGVYQTGRKDVVELRQDGDALTGCYTEQSGHTVGTLTGHVDGGVARLSWRSDKGIAGTAVLVVDSEGALNGVRYRDRSRSLWQGAKAAAGVSSPCSRAAPPANPVADALEKDGKVRLYGILFDFDEATLRPESTPALRQLLAALEADANLSLAVEGHTDSDGDDAYNLALSERRARSVVAWLTGHGVAATRLMPVGEGEARPVASNDTADGRALNRRVEAVKR